jgi:hypothetical protein
MGLNCQFHVRNTFNPPPPSPGKQARYILNTGLGGPTPADFTTRTLILLCELYTSRSHWPSNYSGESSLIYMKIREALKCIISRYR